MKEKTKTLILASLAQLLAVLVWYNFSAVLDILREEWKLTGSMSGTIIAAFQLGYVLSVIFAGWLSDRIGGRRTFTLCALETGVFNTAFALFADGYKSALIFRTLAGIGQGGLYVPGMRLLSRWYPPEERGKALGIYTSSIIGGFAGAYYIAGPLAASYSWRLAVALTSVTAIPGAAIMYFLVKDEPFGGENLSQGNVSGALMRVSFRRDVLTYKPWMLITGGYVGHNWELFAMYGWIGPYLAACGRAVGMDSSTALALGSVTSATCILMGSFSTGIAGLMSDRFGRINVIMWSLTFSIACSFAYGWLIAQPLFILLSVGLVYGFTIVSDSAVYKAALTELIPEEYLGTALGLQVFFGFIPSVVSPWAFGYILDGYGWNWAWMSVGAGALLGPVCILLLRMHPDRVKMMSGSRME